MKRLQALLKACFVGAVLATPTVTMAQFDGHTINYQYFFPDLSSFYANASNGNYLVGPGLEIQLIPPAMVDSYGTLDIGGNQITVLFNPAPGFAGAVFNGFRIQDVFGELDPFTSVTINALTTLGGGFGASNVSFDADNIFVNWQGLQFFDGQRLVLDVGGIGAPIPEPETYAMLLLGLALLGFEARRRKQKPAV